MHLIPRNISLTLTALTAESWSAFGSLPSDEPANTGSNLEFLWNDGQVNFIAHDISELTFTRRCRKLSNARPCVFAALSSALVS